MTEEEVFRVIAAGRAHLQNVDRPSLTDEEIQEYARRVCGSQRLSDGTRQDFRKMFTILFLLDRGWDIVLLVDAEISDAQLPLKAVFAAGPDGAPDMRLLTAPDTPLACLSDWSPMTHERFEATQWAVLAPFLARGTRRKAHFYQLSEKDVLPWTKEDPIREGGYGWISKIEIHPSHHNFGPLDRDTKPSALGTNVFAVKHFKPNKPDAAKDEDTDARSDYDRLQAIRREFEREIEILNRFSGDTHAHLISLQAAFRHGDEYCVIIPWADKDLKSMWEHERIADPLDRESLKWLLEQCRGIASGLVNIHFYQTSEIRDPSEGGSGDDDAASNRHVYGRHGDIKPENILIFRDAHTPNDRGRLVITDFGLTRFHSDDTKTYFPRRAVAATWTYRPPECDMEGCKISRSFDIWSLGCVLLEFVAWYLGGWDLVREFVQRRKVSNPLVCAFNIDQFFELVRPEGQPDGNFYSRVKHEVHDVSLPSTPTGVDLTPECYPRAHVHISASMHH